MNMRQRDASQRGNPGYACGVGQQLAACSEFCLLGHENLRFTSVSISQMGKSWEVLLQLGTSVLAMSSGRVCNPYAHEILVELGAPVFQGECLRRQHSVGKRCGIPA